jgi:hypothetical protein
MKTSALKNSSWLLLAILGSLAFLASAQKSYAADTAVSCNTPQVQLAAGRDGTKPRLTVYCAGGSSVSPIVYFAFEISSNEVGALSIAPLVASWVAENGAASPITIYSNLSDTSGAAWGCGASNCRIIDYITGY